MDLLAEKVRNALAQSELFTAGDADFFINRNCPQKVLTKGDTLFAKGETSDRAYVIIEGVLGLYDIDSMGSSSCFRRVIRGDLVGEYGTLCNLERSASGVAFTDVLYIELDKALIEELIQGSPKFALRLVQTLSRAASLGRNINQSSAGSVVILNEHGNSSLTSRLLLHIEPILARISTDPCHSRGYELIHIIDDEQHLHELLLNSCIERSVLYIFVIKFPAFLSKRNQVLVDRLFVLTEGEAELSWRHLDLLIKPILTRVWPDNQINPTSAVSFQAHLFSFVLNLRVSDASHHARFCRFIFRRQNILCLGGGGSRGFAHVGAIKAFEELGLNAFDCVHGVSFGALVTIFRAFDVNAQDIFAILERHIVKQRAYSLSLGFSSIFSLRNSKRFIDKIFLGLSLQDAWLPVRILSADLNTSASHYWSTGSISDAVISSMSVPAIFEPQRDCKNGLHVDGGILCNLPVELAKRETNGLVVAIALDRLPNDESSSVIADEGDLNLLKTVVISLLCSSRSATNQNRQLADLLIEPPVGRYPFLDWSRYRQIYAEGYHEVMSRSKEFKSHVALRGVFGAPRLDP